MGAKKSSLSQIKHLEDELEFDEKMKEAQEMDKRTTNIILLGAMDTGKSTILRQMMAVFLGIDHKDFESLTSSIKNAVISYIKTLCTQSIELHQEQQTQSILSHNQWAVTGYIRNCEFQNELNISDNEVVIQTCIQYFGNNEGQTFATQDLTNLYDYFNTLTYPFHLDLDMAQKIKLLWADPGIKETFRLRYKYHLQENVHYFLDNVVDIAQEEYTPGFDDYMRFALPSTGFTEKVLTSRVGAYGQWCFRIVDVGGGRSERKKYLSSASTADGFDMMVFVVALNEYNKTCFEDSSSNRLHESLSLFRRLCEDDNWNALRRIIILNKYDLFQETIVDTPITVCFDDFPTNDKSPYDEEHVIAFIQSKFEECSKLEEHFIRANALDAENLEMVFEPIMKGLVHSKLVRDGLL
eukprot:325027_1